VDDGINQKDQNLIRIHNIFLNMPKNDQSDYDARKKIVLELVSQFKIERYVYMTLSIASFIALMWLAFSAYLNEELSVKETLLLFAPTGVMTYAINRILYMWTKSMQIIFTGKL
jgi:hypothetical protein